MKSQQFAIKNQRRREAREADRRQYREGRRSRREFARNGAFGNLNGYRWEKCAEGTSGTPA